MLKQQQQVEDRILDEAKAATYWDNYTWDELVSWADECIRCGDPAKEVSLCCDFRPVP